MERARAAAVAALFAVLVVATVALGAMAPSVRSSAAAAAAVTWPVSTLVVSEVQTGGASASDEFVEIANAGAADIDLAGMEIAYVTSTGGTITRKATWAASTILSPGRHLLLANSAGAYASIADAAYSGGLAATGGTIVLRVVGGAPVDAIGWGDATNAFVEGAPAPAPAAGSSLERGPGGPAGNSLDTNSNAGDWFLQPAPNPQDLAAPPVPAPGPSSTPSPAPTATATATPSDAPTASPIATAGPTPSADPSGTPEPTLTPTPTAVATPDPTVPPTDEPTPTPTAPPTSSPAPTTPPVPDPTPEPTTMPTPAPTALPIADARALAIGQTAVIEGVLTTGLGALEAGRAGFVQDDTAGIAIYLDAALADPVPAGRMVRLSGEVDERYGARTLRVALADIADLGPGNLPEATSAASGSIGEQLEGLRVRVAGTTSGSPTAYADGLGLLVDDGSGPVRVIVGDAALAGASVPAGSSVTVIGPVGQRDSTGTGTTGYRILSTLAGELTVAPPTPTPTPTPVVSPSPSPTSTPQPTTAPSPTPSPSPTPAPSPSPSPSPTPSPLPSIADVRLRPLGATVVASGVVTAELGRIGTPPLIVIGDSTGGIAVRLPEGVPAPARGSAIRVSGSLAAPYGQLEIRPTSSGIVVQGTGSLPAAVAVVGSDLGERTEGMLVAIDGTQVGAARRAATGDITIDVSGPDGSSFRILSDASSGIVVGDLRAGTAHRFTGIVGQHASKKGAQDGYRVWLRDRSDIGAPAPADAVGAGSGGASGSTVVAIAATRGLDESPATVEGVVTSQPGLLDADGTRIVIQDATGGIEVLLPAAVTGPPVGTRIRVAGVVGRAWGAPRIRAATIVLLGTAAEVLPKRIARAPGEVDEWQLVRIAGTVKGVTRLGDRWRADVQVGTMSVLVAGLAGSGVPSTALDVGRAVTIVGFVHRPYPTATDRRWAITPRGPWDVAVGPAGADASTTGTGGSPGRGSAIDGSATGTIRPGAYLAGSAGPDGTRDADLAALVDRAGTLVRVGGLVTAVASDGFSLDDGTAIGRVVLRGEAASFLGLLHAGDALGVVGRVEPRGGTLVLVVDDPAGVVRLGALGEVVPIAALATSAASSGSTGAAVATAGLGDGWSSIADPRLGLGGLVALLAVSLGATFVRRRSVRRRLLRVVAARVATLGKPPDAA